MFRTDRDSFSSGATSMSTALPPAPSRCSSSTAAFVFTRPARQRVDDDQRAVLHLLRRAPRAARRARPSSAARSRSCAAAARTRCRPAATAGCGSSRRARGRCPSAATASCRCRSRARGSSSRACRAAPPRSAWTTDSQIRSRVHPPAEHLVAQVDGADLLVFVAGCTHRSSLHAPLLLALLRLLDLRDLDASWPPPPSARSRSRSARRECRPRRISRWLSASTRSTFRLRVGHAAAAHPPRRAHALDDARRERRGADRAGRAVEHRAVRRRAAGEVVALDDALESLAAAGADDVHAVAVGEDRDEHLVARLERRRRPRPA